MRYDAIVFYCLWAVFRSVKYLPYIEICYRFAATVIDITFSKVPLCLQTISEYWWRRIFCAVSMRFVYSKYITCKITKCSGNCFDAHTTQNASRQTHETVNNSCINPWCQPDYSLWTNTKCTMYQCVYMCAYRQQTHRNTKQHVWQSNVQREPQLSYNHWEKQHNNYVSHKGPHRS